MNINWKAIFKGMIGFVLADIIVVLITRLVIDKLIPEKSD